MAKITPEELIQNVQEFLQEDLKVDPPQVERFYTSNIFSRVFAHLVGRAATSPKMLRCTEAGELKTAPTTTGIEQYHPRAGIAEDTWSVFKVFESTVSRVDIFIWDNPALFRLQRPDGTEGYDLEIPVGFYSVDIRTKAFKIMNKTEGQVARYQIIGWW